MKSQRKQQNLPFAVFSSKYLTKIRIQLFIISHPLDLIHRIRIFGIACPSNFFAQIKRVEIALVFVIIKNLLKAELALFGSHYCK